MLHPNMLITSILLGYATTLMLPHPLSVLLDHPACERIILKGLLLTIVLYLVGSVNTVV